MMVNNMIYTHKNSQPYNFALVTKIVLVSMLIISFTTLAKARYSEEYVLDRILNHCELIGGVYEYEDNICVVSYDDNGSVIK